MSGVVTTVSAAVSAAAAIVMCSLYLGRRIMHLVRAIDRIAALPGRYDSMEKILTINSEAIHTLTTTVATLSGVISAQAGP